MDFPQEFFFELIGVVDGFDGVNCDGNFVVEDSVAELALVSKLFFEVGVAFLEAGGIIRFEWLSLCNSLTLFSKPFLILFINSLQRTELRGQFEIFTHKL